MILERLWQETGCQKVIGRLLQGRKFEFPVERALFLTVLHRLFTSGSDRAAEKWKETLHIEGIDRLQLHHLYRAMAWLGEPLPEDQQAGATPFSPRCTKDLVEEGLFAHCRDLFGVALPPTVQQIEAPRPCQSSLPPNYRAWCHAQIACA